MTHRLVITSETETERMHHRLVITSETGEERRLPALKTQEKRRGFPL